MSVWAVRVARDSMIGALYLSFNVCCGDWPASCQSMKRPDEGASHEEDEPELKINVVHKSA